MGPSAFRIAGLGEQIASLGRKVIDKGNLPAPVAVTEDAIDTLVAEKRLDAASKTMVAKTRIAAGLYEIRLFRHDPLVVLAATAKILLRNGVYVAHNLVPMALVLLPMLAVLTQLEANYAFAPGPVGVDVGAGRATGWGTDTLVGIHNVVGSAFADVLHGWVGGTTAAGDAMDYNRAPGDRKHRSHRFIGANQFHPRLHALPGGDVQVALTEEWLRGDTPLPEVAHKWASGPSVPIQIVAPAEAAPGEEFRVRVVVSSNKVGHDFPTGPLDISQSWIELVATDPDGNVANIAWPVSVTETEHFLLALGDGAISTAYVSGGFSSDGAELDGMTADSMARTDHAIFHGRVALYYKGRIKGGKLMKNVRITAHLDTAKQAQLLGIAYTVTEGQRFARLYRMVSVEANCARFLYGDESFSLCEELPPG